MDSLLAHPEQGGRTAKRKQTAFPAGYGTKIAKDMQNDFFHFPLRQINGYGGGCFVGWRYHVQRLVYSFMKVQGYCACPAAETGSKTTGPKSTRAAYLCGCCLDRCTSKAPAKPNANTRKRSSDKCLVVSSLSPVLRGQPGRNPGDNDATTRRPQRRFGRVGG